MRRVLLAATTMVTVGMSLCASALGATPIGGATYNAVPAAQFANSADQFEALTASTRRDSISSYHLNVPSSCTDGSTQDWFVTNKGRPAIPVDSAGSFSTSIQFAASTAGGTQGNLTFTVTGGFVTTTHAMATIAVSFTPTATSGVSCSGSVSFTAVTDPRLPELAKLTPPSHSQVSGAMATSSSGSAVVLGGRNAAYVYLRPARGWRSEQATKIAAPRGAGSGFGAYVAISGNGRTIVVGSEAVTNHPTGTPAYVFTRIGSSSRWRLSARLPLARASGVVPPVTLDENGSRLFTETANDVNVYLRHATRSGVHYVRIATLKGAAGLQLAASANGNTLAVLVFGQVNVYSRPRVGGWKKAGKPIVLTETVGNLDTELAVNGNGSVVIAGDNEHGLNYAGSVWVFRRPGARWSGHVKPAARLNGVPTPCNSAGVCDQIGSTLAISPDGQEVAGGAGISNRTLLFLKPSGGWRHEHEAYQLDTPGTPADLAVAGGDVFVQDDSLSVYVFGR